MGDLKFEVQVFYNHRSQLILTGGKNAAMHFTLQAPARGKSGENQFHQLQEFLLEASHNELQ